MRKQAILTSLLLLSGPISHEAEAEVVVSSPDYYLLKHEVTVSQPVEQVWDRLIQPQSWWSPDHTYSGSSDNLSFDEVAGGLWREDWDGNSVVHGTVLLIQENQLLRLNAPFGPLQAMGVNVVWTITLTPIGDRTRITFDEVANGTPNSALHQLAPAVDGVKQEAIERLAGTYVRP